MKKVIIISVIGLFGFLAITNPSEKSHKEKIKEELFKAMEPSKPSDGWALLGWNMGQTIVERAIDTQVKRTNYVICSRVAASNGKTISFGILGMVFSDIKGKTDL
jgi:hypothetical protein